MHIVNCKYEEKLFRTLLKCRDNKRILSIRSDTGTGKSTLLDRFEYICREDRNNRYPVTRINLDQGDTPTILDLMRKISNQLATNADTMRFAQFDEANDAFILNDPKRVNQIKRQLYSEQKNQLYKPRVQMQGGTTDITKQDFRGSDFSYSQNAKIIGRSTELNLYLQMPNNVNSDELLKVFLANILKSSNEDVAKADFDDEKEKLAQKDLEDIFLIELKQLLNHNRNRRYSNKNGAVLILDTYESASQDVKNWMKERFLEEYFFDPKKRPRKLLMIVAGQEVPSFQNIWSEQDCVDTITSVNNLSQWKIDDMDEVAKYVNSPQLTNMLKMYFSSNPEIIPKNLVSIAQVLRNGHIGDSI